MECGQLTTATIVATDTAAAATCSSLAGQETASIEDHYRSSAIAADMAAGAGLEFATNAQLSKAESRQATQASFALGWTDIQHSTGRSWLRAC